MLDLTPDRLIGSQLKITLNDSRILDGVLTAIDPFGNLLLSNTYEFSNNLHQQSLENYRKRELGLVSVPRERLLKIFIDRKSHGNLTS